MGCVRAIGVVVVGASTMTSAVAHAEGARGAKWVIEVDGQTCVEHRAGFERELVLACEAMSTCQVASRRDAELEATLRCEQEDRWWLDTKTIDGKALASVALTGASPEDRMREAAVEIARDAAPERALAAEVLQNTLGGERDRVAGASAGPTRVAAAAGALATTRSDTRAAFGARALVGYRLEDIGWVSLAAAGALREGAPNDRFRGLRGGVGWSLGAPFDAKVLGGGVELGIDGAQYSYKRTATADGAEYGTRTGVYGYAQVNLFVQAPLRTVRPYAGFAFTVLSRTDLPTVTAFFDAGLAFPVF